MRYCDTRDCGSLLTDIYTSNGWMSICPVCGKKTSSNRKSKPSEADIRAKEGFSQQASEDALEFESAEDSFTDAADNTRDEELKLGYIWWAVLCHYGVKYVQDGTAFIPIMARFPLPNETRQWEKRLELFKKMLNNDTSGILRSKYSEIRQVFEETLKYKAELKKKYDVFIAWHDRGGSKQCRTFAEQLQQMMIKRSSDYRSFASFTDLQGEHPEHYEPIIYTALATARVLVVVVDDFSACKEKFLKWEILRMKVRKSKNPEIVILYEGLKNTNGNNPGHLEGIQARLNLDVASEGKDVELVWNDIKEELNRSKLGYGRDRQERRLPIATEAPEKEKLESEYKGIENKLDMSDFSGVKEDAERIAKESYYGKATDREKGRLYKYLLWAERGMRWSDDPHKALVEPFYGPNYNAACRYGYRAELESINRSLMQNIHDFVEKDVDLHDALRYQVDEPEQCGNDYRYLWECLLFHTRNMTELCSGENEEERINCTLHWFEMLIQWCPEWLYKKAQVWDSISKSTRTTLFWDKIRTEVKETVYEKKIEKDHYYVEWAENGRYKKQSWVGVICPYAIAFVFYAVGILLCLWAAIVGSFCIVLPKGIPFDDHLLFDICTLLTKIQEYAPQRNGFAYAGLALHIVLCLCWPLMAYILWKKKT